VLSGERLGQGQRHFREGLEAYQRRDLDAAVRHFTLAIESGDLAHPDLFFAFNNRGNAYAARGDYDRALKDDDEALRFIRSSRPP
jgi:tetratricopeptide (TPR) repeat protein